MIVQRVSVSGVSGLGLNPKVINDKLKEFKEWLANESGLSPVITNPLCIEIWNEEIEEEHGADWPASNPST